MVSTLDGLGKFARCGDALDSAEGPTDDAGGRFTSSDEVYASKALVVPSQETGAADELVFSLDLADNAVGGHRLPHPAASALKDGETS